MKSNEEEKKKERRRKKVQSRGRVQIQVVNSREQKEEFGGEVLENAGGGTRDSRRSTEEPKVTGIDYFNFWQQREDGFD